ncbi:hypothetical protein ACLOJK_032001 [Asimina triloba]
MEYVDQLAREAESDYSNGPRLEGEEKQENRRYTWLHTKWAITLSLLEVGGTQVIAVDDSPQKGVSESEAHA